MKLLLLFAFLCCFGYSQAQSDPDTLVPGDFVYVPNHFYHDYAQDFLTWRNDTPPQTFSAVLFDRWGEVMLETTDPGFNFDGFVKEKNPKKFGTYTLLLQFSVPGRETPFEVRKQLTHMGFYCNG